MRYRLDHDRLAQILAASKISQNHWAIRLGLSRGHWSDIVNGRHLYPSAKTRERMVEVFGVADLFLPELSQRGADVDFRIAVSGRYELASEIGQGGMGSVYLANDLALGRVVALKVVSAEAVAGIGADQLLQEIAVVSRLQHPNILPLFDAGKGAGSPYYVMPLVRSGSLGARLRARGRLPLGEVVGLVRAIAAGLAHAHDHRVLHCDIKPENILVDSDHAYVMDFGIARKLHTEAAEWSDVRKELDFSAGTPAYVSPEQAAGNAYIDERSDVYSMGCVVYELLTGRAAFAGKNTQEIVSLRFREPPPPLQQFAPDVPYEVARVIDRALALDPDQRPSSATTFAAQLTDAAATASSTRTMLAVTATRAARWVRSRSGRGATAPIRTGAMRRWFDTLRQDIVYGFRQRRRSPGLTAVALVTLALTIGLTTAVFALVDGVLLRSLPFVDADRLIALQSVDSSGSAFSLASSANWSDWKRENRTLDRSALYQAQRASVVSGENALRVESALVSAEFFDVLRATFVHGRGFDSAEVAQSSGGAIVTEGFWRRELGASHEPNLSIRVNGFSMPVIGVIADAHALPLGAQVWTGLRVRPQSGGARNNINWGVVARLKPGVTVDDARLDLSAIAQRIRQAEPVALYSYGVIARPLQEEIVGDSSSLLRLLTGSVVMVLLIGCANLASANLAQGARRQREMAVRSALGAGRRRLIRQVLIENVMLAVIGGAIGALLAWVIVQTVSAVGIADLPRLANVSIDGRVLSVTLAVSALAGVITGLLPALQAARAAPNETIGRGSRGAVFGGRGLPGRVLVGAEIALALMLVTGAGLLLQSLRTVLSRPLGIETARVAAARITLGGPQYTRDTLAIHAYWSNLLRALRQAPGVHSAAAAATVPLVQGWTGFIDVEGKDLPGIGAGYRIVSWDYTNVLGMTVRAGRAFSRDDGALTPRVAMINQAMADRYWPSESPLGRRVRASSMEPTADGAPAPWIEVIGVVNDVRHFGYDAEVGPEMFVLYDQLPSWRLTTMTAIVRGRVRSEELVRVMRTAVAHVDPAIPADFELLDAAARRNTAERRFSASVLQVFSVLSLLLASIGVYGVLSFSVAQRTREIAVRAALGAQRQSLLRLVLGSGVAVVAAGLVAGVAGALAAGRLIEAMLFEVSARDPVVLVSSAAIIAVVGVAAAIVPARRATRVDPMVVLRNE